ncbi:MAG: hypothetical protein M1826_003456 [Phylliscum demangeonii]|nr:MAG: hypothetical protein M1826_003456 [Phylliscum demangeonii]
MSAPSPVSQSPLTLPIIDISPFLPSSTSTSAPSPSPSRSQSQCAHLLAQACHDHGFFYLTGHAIPAAVTDTILAQASTFFRQAPSTEKAQLARAGRARGYQRVGENVTLGKRDWHEAIDWYREWDADESEVEHAAAPMLRGRNPWPRTPPSLEAVYRDYVVRLLGLGRVLMRAMGLALTGLALPSGDGDGAGSDWDPDVFVKHTAKSFWVMRMIGYPPLPLPSSSSSSSAPAAAEAEAESDDGISCGAHTDYGCLTFLLADDTRGALQVQHRATGRWISADPVAGAFVVNIGDMMERWTNGLWKSTLHRVVHRPGQHHHHGEEEDKGRQWRFSVPFFFEPDFEARIEPLRKCVALTGGEKRFGVVRYGDWLRAKVEGNFVRGEGEGQRKADGGGGDGS